MRLSFCVQASSQTGSGWPGSGKHTGRAMLGTVSQAGIPGDTAGFYVGRGLVGPRERITKPILWLLLCARAVGSHKDSFPKEV